MWKLYRDSTYVDLIQKPLLKPLILEANKCVLILLNYSGSLFIELTSKNIS